MEIVEYRKREFKLPDDWVVEVCPRHSSSVKHSDKYYYEPGTGRKFRSLLSVKRHLTGDDDQPLPLKKPTHSLLPYHPSGPLRRVVFGGKLLTLDELEEARYTNSEDISPETSQSKKASTLPDGWIVEDVPRRCGSTRDRYYIDPTTGNKFRSLREVHKYLEPERYEPNSKPLTLSNRSTAPRSTLLKKKNTSTKMVKHGIFDLMNPPEKINWVYSGDVKDNWSPLVDGCVLPDYVKEQWSETFLLGMNGWKHHVPQLTM